MSLLVNMADNALLPDQLIRFGIRQFDRKRLREENHQENGRQRQAIENFIDRMKQSPIAIQTHKANEQHYEMPPAFFERVLGQHLKYSGCYWPAGVDSLNQAETAMLAMTCQRAELTDGIRILELGCGWGSLSLLDGSTLSRQPDHGRFQFEAAAQVYRIKDCRAQFKQSAGYHGRHERLQHRPTL